MPTHHNAFPLHIIIIINFDIIKGMTGTDIFLKKIKTFFYYTWYLYILSIA